MNLSLICRKYSGIPNIELFVGLFFFFLTNFSVRILRGVTDRFGESNTDCLKS